VSSRLCGCFKRHSAPRRSARAEPVGAAVACAAGRAMAATLGAVLGPHWH
jgi:hypothetical protein